MAKGLKELADDLVNNPTACLLWAALVIVLLVLVFMAQTKVGFYPETLVSSGTEIEPDYIPGTDMATSVITNQFGGNSTGGISGGAAVRSAAENTSGTASHGEGRTYVYTTRLDEATRNYKDPEGPAFAVSHGHVQG